MKSLLIGTDPQRTMKTHTLTALAAFLLGVALTLGGQWLSSEVKTEAPASQPSKAPASSRQAPAAAGVDSPDQPGKSGREPAPVVKVTTEQKEKLAALKVQQKKFDRTKWIEQSRERQLKFGQRETERRLALWAEKLGLTDRQVAELRTLLGTQLEERLARIGQKGGMLNPADQRAELDALLDTLLDEEQKDAYTDLQESERQNEIEARATRRLADLQTRLHLNDEQKDQVFEVLHAQEAERGSRPSNGKQEYQAFIDSGGTNEGWREHYEEMQRVAREEQLDQMRDVLNERQLGAYGDFLEGRGGKAVYHSSSGATDAIRLNVTK